MSSVYKMAIRNAQTYISQSYNYDDYGNKILNESRHDAFEFANMISILFIKDTNDVMSDLLNKELK